MNLQADNGTRSVIASPVQPDPSGAGDQERFKTALRGLAEILTRDALRQMKNRRLPTPKKHRQT